ncbi:hypothetical protein [Parapedobacter koreensis]|uniref:Uncharacterized protein n=1 Tax=Parapedobacter koreensis TaxID=332977 RepID=A0A1H7UBR9_9SPHI|nr:hypothetical protein [Parapedobacter koreensis]SEL94216.1 hypothetical protein SAMN05421740_11474 [Parapedobacter koreensis]
MDFLFFWGLVILLVIAIVVALIYASYWLPKRLGKRKLGRWLSGILTTGVVALFFATVFEDQLFFKTDAAERLGEHHIELKDDFKLVSNKSGGFLDYYHIFVLAISPEDKNRIINHIVAADNYQDNEVEMFDIRNGKPRYSEKGTSFTANYQDEWNYIYEFYQPNKRGYTPTWDRISISKAENTLVYERILD